MKWLALLVLLGALGTIPLGMFYVGEIREARRLTDANQLPDYYANAIQHSHAAASAYRGLRVLLPPDAAEHAVLTLGLMNEWFERAFRPHDHTLEMMKDFYNNQAGIMVGRALEEQEGADRHAAGELLVRMARDRKLILKPEELAVDNQRALLASADVAGAWQWFRREREHIRHTTAQYLQHQ